MEKKASLKSYLENNIVAFTLLLFTVAFILQLTSCSGCSESGRRSKKEIYQESVVKRSEILNIQPKVGVVESELTRNDLASLFKKSQQAVFIIYTTDGYEVKQGSGFFITPDGVGISNYHVFKSTIKGSEKIKLFNGDIYKIEQVILVNTSEDYIVFKIKSDQRVSFLSGSDVTPKIGDDVFAIGNPMGLENTLSKGIVSGYRKGGLLIQTTAEITHGSSGGPLLNMQGEVVGITTSGIGEANLNFAINISRINLNKIIKSE